MFEIVRPIQNVSSLDDFYESLCLWVLHADKIPPHIGVSLKGRFYSLKANGKDEKVKVATVTQIINAKNIKTLVYLLKDGKGIDLSKSFENYDKTIVGKVTCLNPIKDALNIPNALKIHDLIDELEAQSRVEKCLGFNIDRTFKGLQNYDVEAIHSRLSLLDEDRSK